MMVNRQSHAESEQAQMKSGRVDAWTDDNNLQPRRISLRLLESASLKEC